MTDKTYQCKKINTNYPSGQTKYDIGLIFMPVVQYVFLYRYFSHGVNHKGSSLKTPYKYCSMSSICCYLWFPLKPQFEIVNNKIVDK